MNISIVVSIYGKPNSEQIFKVSKLFSKKNEQIELILINDNKDSWSFEDFLTLKKMNCLKLTNNMNLGKFKSTLFNLKSVKGKYFLTYDLDDAINISVLNQLALNINLLDYDLLINSYFISDDYGKNYNLLDSKKLKTIMNPNMIFSTKTVSSYVEKNLKTIMKVKNFSMFEDFFNLLILLDEKQRNLKIKEINVPFYKYIKDIGMSTTNKSGDVETLKSIEAFIIIFGNKKIKGIKSYSRIKRRFIYFILRNMFEHYERKKDLIKILHSQNIYFYRRKRNKYFYTLENLLRSPKKEVSLDTKNYITFDEYQQKVVKIFKKINESFMENDIFWWMHSGSLLGLIREKKLIDNDDDIDMAMHFKTIRKNKKKIIEILDKYNCDLYEAYHLPQRYWIYKIISRESYNVKIRNENEYDYFHGKRPFIDIMIGINDFKLFMNKSRNKSFKHNKGKLLFYNKVRRAMLVSPLLLYSHAQRPIRQIDKYNKNFVYYFEYYFLRFILYLILYLKSLYVSKHVIKYDEFIFRNITYDLTKMKQTKFYNTSVYINEDPIMEVEIWYDLLWRIPSSHLGRFNHLAWSQPLIKKEYKEKRWIWKK